MLKGFLDGLELDVVVLVVLELCDFIEDLVDHVEVLVLAEKLELQLLQPPQVLLLQAIVLQQQRAVFLEELGREAKQQEALVLAELLLQALDQEAALVVECLEAALYALQLLLLIGVLVLPGGGEVVLQLGPGDAEESLVAFLDLLAGLELPARRPELLELLAVLRVEKGLVYNSIEEPLDGAGPPGVELEVLAEEELGLHEGEEAVGGEGGEDVAGVVAGKDLRGEAVPRR